MREENWIVKFEGLLMFEIFLDFGVDIKCMLRKIVSLNIRKIVYS